LGHGKAEPAAGLAGVMRLPLALALALLLVAGCSSPSGDDAPSPPDSDSYRLSVANVPATPLAPNSTFSFDLFAEGSDDRASDHIGGHFGNTTTATPSTTVYASACIHQSGTLPGEYQVTCTAPAKPGVYFLRGHARIIQDNVTTQWWSAETTFSVA
jgi:hypothetical protein